MSCLAEKVSFRNFTDHPSSSCYSMDQVKDVLWEQHPFTYLMIPSDQGQSCYLCFYDEQKDFHSHLLQIVQAKEGPRWKNGSHKTFKRLEDLIPYSMGILPGSEISFR